MWGLNSRGGFSENLLNGPNKCGRGKLGNPYLKIGFKIMLFVPTAKLINLFSMAIQLWQIIIS